MKLVWQFVLVIVLLTAKYRDADAQQSAIWGIRTQDSVVVDPHYPMAAHYPTPAVYTKWLHAVEQCANVTLPDSVFAQIRFVEINAPDFKINDDSAQSAPSLAASAVDEGLTFISVAHMYNWRTVSHELLHYALYSMFGNKYEDKHPPEYFDKCGLYSAEERARER